MPDTVPTRSGSTPMFVPAVVAPPGRGRPTALPTRTRTRTRTGGGGGGGSQTTTEAPARATATGRRDGARLGVAAVRENGRAAMSERHPYGFIERRGIRRCSRPAAGGPA